MKKWIGRAVLPVLAVICLLVFGTDARAESANTIKNGIYAGQISLAGMTEDEAVSAVEEYIDQLSQVEITIQAAAGNQVVVTAGEFGLTWTNPELVSEAARLGTQGNVIERYKMLKDLEYENKVFPVYISFDQQAISDFLVAECAQFDMEAEDGYLIREGDRFQIVEGKIGYKLDVETSIDRINDYLMNEWDYQPCMIALDIAVEEPRGSVEELSAVQDMLGTSTTSFSATNVPRNANIFNGCKLINGTTLYPGDEFSTCEAVGPFTAQNGYHMAGSYLNGKVVDSLGGGICQVSTTLYNAVLGAELEVTERYNHSMIVTYVNPAADAAIAETAGKDFKFINNLDYPIYIEGYADNSSITFNIYGKETRGEGYAVRYESEVLEVTHPVGDMIYADESLPLGYITVESAFTGYKARLWKVVTQDGVEISRTQVNSSSYKMVPRSATVGTATADPHAHEEIMAAIGTGSIDHVKNVIALLVPPPPEAQ